MALSRRFLNLILDNGAPGAKSLHCIDLTRQHLFNTTPPSKPPNENRSESLGLEADTCNQKNMQVMKRSLKMDRIRLPRPLFNFVASRSGLNDQGKIDWFPLVDRRVICADQWGRSFLVEADRQRVVILPRLHEPKVMPISLFIPSPYINKWDGSSGGSLYIMERNTKPGLGNQFEAFIYRNPDRISCFKSWDCRLIPPPPYVYDAKYMAMCPEITSYAVLGDGSNICISVDGVGTYCLDTRSHTWSEVGRWMLPFYGKVEYVPELKLWLGLSAKAQDLAAADLSSMDSQPKLVGTCKEFDPPAEWEQCKDSQLVNLGSGKFCIARFFHTRTPNRATGDELTEQNITVLTGLEVVRCFHDADSNAEVELQMTPHKSRRYTTNGSNAIKTVF
ncbi:hypothetical protein BS78_07G003300 [Paspalum vaginatum]|nr:hypothetical protein BS78_07G003300 [Paspalum vaginatum]